ncbi:MAG: aerial mycelium formation protein [Actinomycetota bacterium]
MAEEGKRRMDRILRPEYLEGLEALSLEQIRERRDECLAEREYLSLLRRQVQGRAEILKAELERRGGGEVDSQPLIERLSTILAPETSHSPSRGEALRVALPDEDMLQARRRAERLVADTGLSDPSSLTEEQLSRAVETLVAEEQEVSEKRAAVIAAHDRLQDELKRRYKQDISQVLS